MPSFLMAWHRATVDLKASYRRGGRRNLGVGRAQYIVPEQTKRGVGPGVGLTTTVTQIHVGDGDPAHRPAKRARTE
eukprot:11688517-Alexandrium_andersonii.AAC.1